MNRADHKTWATARDLEDIGRLTAQWLEGRLGSHPSYYGAPEDETAELITVLSACNRMGYVTDSSQPGGSGTCDGGTWVQRAAVSGYATPDTWASLQDACADAGLIIFSHEAPRWRTCHKTAVPVTHTDGYVCTSFGSSLSRGHLERVAYAGCHRDGTRAVAAALQVTLIDPEWGREHSPLWPVLAAFAGLVVAA